MRRPASGLRSALILRVALALLIALGLAPAPSTGSSWPHHPASRVSGAHWWDCSGILVVDARGWSGGERIAGATLQGIVNRGGPRLVLVYSDGDLTVFKYFIENVLGCSFRLERLSLEDLAARYSGHVRGVVVYDDGLADTVNLATVVAALNDLIAAPPRVAERLSEAGIPVAVDLRGEYRDRVEVYRAILNLTGRLNTTALVVMNAGYAQLRDYAVKHRLPVVSLDPTVPWERRLLDDILDRVSGRLVLGFFPGGGEGEVEGVKLASRHGKTLIVADLASSLSFAEWFSNLTPPPPPRPPEPPALEPGGAYASIIVSDGDNIGFLVNVLATGRYWLHPSRGSVPVGWTVNPWIARLAPHVAWFLYSTAKRGDCFLSAAAGAGYIEPSIMARGDLEALARGVEALLGELGLDSALFWAPPGYRGVEVFSRVYDSIFVAVADRLQGFPGVTLAGGVPVLYSPVVDSSNYRAILDSIVGNVSLRPLFLAVVVDAWSFNYSLILDLAGYLESKGFKLACPQALARLAGDYLRGPGYPGWDSLPWPGVRLEAVASAPNAAGPDRILVYSNATDALLASISGRVQLAGPGREVWTECSGGGCFHSNGSTLTFHFKAPGYEVVKEVEAVDGLVHVRVEVNAPGYEAARDPALDELDVRVWPPVGPRQPASVAGPLYAYTPQGGLFEKELEGDAVICRGCGLVAVYSTGYPYPRILALYVQPAEAGGPVAVADYYGSRDGDGVPEIHSLTIEVPLRGGRAAYEYWIIPLTHGWAYKPPAGDPEALGREAVKRARELIEAVRGGTPTSTPTPTPTNTGTGTSTETGNTTEKPPQPPGPPGPRAPLLLAVALALLALAAILLALAGRRGRPAAG